MSQTSQRGSAHVVIIIGLVVALVCALGIVFYQNFIVSKDSSKTVKPVAASADSNTAKSDNSNNTSKHHCFKNEPVCFDYPATWSVTEKSVAFPQGYTDVAVSRDSAEILNDKGEAMLRFNSGISGIGGACGPSEFPRLYSLIHAAQPTKIQSSPSEYTTDHLYAVQYVKKTNDGYTATYGLTEEKRATEVGSKIDSCSPGYLVVPGTMKLSKEGDVTGGFAFSELGFGSDIKLMTFKTEADALATFETPDAKAAFEILKSAHY